MKYLILAGILFYALISCQNNQNQDFTNNSKEITLKNKTECANASYTQFVSNHLTIKPFDFYEHIIKGRNGCVPKHKLNLTLSNLFTSIDITLGGVSKKAILFDAIYMHSHDLNEEFSPGCLITTSNVLNDWNSKINNSQICPDPDQIGVGICDREVTTLIINNVLYYRIDTASLIYGLIEISPSIAGVNCEPQ